MRASSKSILTGLVVVGLLASAMAIGAFASSQASQASTSQSGAYLRVVHVSPDAPAVDVYVDNETVLTNVSFGDAGDYLSLDAGEHTVTITAAGERDEALLERNVTLEPRSVTTVAAAGEATQAAENEFDLHNFTDDARLPGSDEAAVRVVHLSPDAETVDVTLATDSPNDSMVLAEDVSYGGSVDYVALPPGDYTVEIRQDAEDADGLVIATANVSIEGGQAYTAWATGFLVPSEPQEMAELTVLLTRDATLTVNLPSEEGTPIETPTEPGTATATGTATEPGTATATGTVTATATAS